MNTLFKRCLATIISTIMLISAIPAIAEEDIFLMSLLPIEEKEAALVLNDYTEDEIKAMPLSTVLSKLQDNDGNYISIPDDASVVWAHFKDEEGKVIRDEYHEIGRNETVDLSEFSYTTGYTMELIVGSKNQLDTGNIRYIVRVYISDVVTEFVDWEFYNQNDETGERKKIQCGQNIMTLPLSFFSDVDIPGTIYGVNIYPENINYREGTEMYLGMSSLKDKHPNYQVLVFSNENLPIDSDGNFITTPINDQIFNFNMEKTNAGFKGIYDSTSTNMLWFVYLKNGEIVQMDAFMFFIKPNQLTYRGIINCERDGVVEEIVAFDSAITDYDNTEIVNRITKCQYTLLEGYSTDEKYYYKLSYDNDIDYLTQVDKAVVGHYNSMEEAANQADIKSLLYGEDSIGYQENYSGDGIDFTIFYIDGTISKLNISVIAYGENIPDFDTAPIIGQADPYFRITGLKQGNKELDSYIIENGGKYNLDTYYGFGYQTILVNDVNADLTKITPEFWPSSEASEGILDIFEGASGGGSKQESGKSEKDFSNGELQYSAVWKDDSNKVRNYQVSVVKKENGPKLYVNGPDKREIFLDDYFEQKHDIFIVNVGDEELKNLKVELVDAENVKLDDYWTVGGENNNTLAAFTTTSTISDYSELPNVAKIRLLPDGDKTGKISGVLKITSNGGTKEIELTGQAGNPDIVTNELADAVKYVPYQRLIMTNNMHEWNEVNFELVDGELPDGVTLYPNGEIYGVPTETGTFKIKVKANYSRDIFESSEMELTLTVKDNTDENVEAETDADDGYGFKTRFPDKVTGEKNEIFEIEYDYDENEFQGVWLDGKKLVKDVDYTVEKGSTKITVKSQTIKNTNNGSHTIAAEYRNSNNQVKKSAQNYNKITKSNDTTHTSSSSGAQSTYKVWLEVNGGAWLQELTIKRDSAIADLPTPERAGYAFGGWYTDKELTTPFEVNTKINKTTTLYAKWIDIHTIWFIENGGEELEDLHIQDGTDTPKLPETVKAGFIFDGWYKDEALTQPFNSNDDITSSMSLYAKWRADVAPDTVLGFDDIHETDWFYSDVDWAYNNKLMVGISNRLFAPNESITGGMVVTVLARIAEADVTEYENNSFDDVYENEWYTPYAKWAKAIGLVDGIPFNPPKEISREWMGIIIMRFLDYMDIDYEVKDEYIEFADADKVSAEAEEALQKLYKIEIFRGKGDNIIDPASNTTRAEFAALMQRTVNFMK